MKLLINILIFLIVLTIPFALSSQIRKAIPAGRFEALSGIKVSHSKVESSSQVNNQNAFWLEVGKSLNPESSEAIYENETKLSLNLKKLIPNKSLKNLKSSNRPLDLLITNDIKNEKLLKKITNKSLIVFISPSTISDLATSFNAYSLVMYQANDNENYYLLKTK